MYIKSQTHDSDTDQQLHNFCLTTIAILGFQIWKWSPITKLQIYSDYSYEISYRTQQANHRRLSTERV